MNGKRCMHHVKRFCIAKYNNQKVAHDTYLVLTMENKLNIVFMTDDEVMKYLVEISNEQRRTF